MSKHGKIVALAVVGLAGLTMLYGCATEEKEVKVAFDKVPAAAQKTFEKEAPGIKIAEVDQMEGKDGKPVYEADVTLEGKNWEIIVAEDGKLVSKEVDDESAEKGEAKK